MVIYRLDFCFYSMYTQRARMVLETTDIALSSGFNYKKIKL